MVEDTEPGEEETPGNVWLTVRRWHPDGVELEPEPYGLLLITLFQKTAVHDPYLQRYSITMYTRSSSEF